MATQFGWILSQRGCLALLKQCCETLDTLCGTSNALVVKVGDRRPEIALIDRGKLVLLPPLFGLELSN